MTIASITTLEAPLVPVSHHPAVKPIDDRATSLIAEVEEAN